MKFNKDNLIKSPLNYVGGKYKLLPQILPYFPDDINLFVDMFSGGGNVGINVEANKIVMNDIESVVIDLMNYLKNNGCKKSLSELKDIIQKYNLSKTNEDGYKRIREDYNLGNKDSMMFYAMLTHAFNYQIRFNKNGEYNMPFGRNRSSFNPNMESNFIKFVNKLSDKHIFTNKDFREIKLDKLNSNDFIYCDPPYLITCASYNDGWNELLERDLLSILDSANDKGIKFAISNVLENKGKENIILKDWAKKYNIHLLDKTYKNCNYQSKDKNKENTTKEVLITNY
ncbi:DNA adenine methylase [Clostridium perfringens]|uniref:DNA adenine methylase n=1 Tax=Clostridium perfringens TaxID=1502 RepID=UPI0039E9DE5D